MYNENVKIPKEILTKRTRGDLTNMAKESKISITTLMYAFKFGECSQSTFEIIKKYYAI